MSAFDDLIAKLTERNLSDMEVDKIVNAGIGLASVLGNSEDILEDLEKLKKQAEDKKQNKDIKYIDGIDNMKDMSDAINSYNARNDKGFINYEAQALLADKLSDLSEKADGKDVYRLANSLMKDSSILENGTKEQKENFAGCLCTAYAFAVDNGKLTPKEALKILDNIDDLAFHTQCPDVAFSNIAICLDDKKVAERFCTYTEKMLNKMEDEGKDTSSSLIIDAFAEIVQHHPEMAGKCNKLVRQSVDSADKQIYSEMLGKAVDFFDKVNVADGVSEKDKSMAKSRSHYYKKAQQRIAERENDDAGYQMEMAWHSHTTGGVEM
ncbi:MAG: hypothetical protein IJE43_23240 [Alphaproteobacteria bacterium]|nr:hypothetical protein [Alphaproteobacteria bacterium]